MTAHKIIAHIGVQSSLKLSNLPFEVGQKVEVIIFPESKEEENQKKITSVDQVSLLGTLKKYIDPYEAAVNSSDWDALK